jgi:hypothetical protein
MRNRPSVADDRAIREAIEALERQEQSIVDEFQRLEIQLAQVRTAKTALLSLESEEPMAFDGNLADTIRTVLKGIGNKSLEPTEVRDRVKAIGYDMSRHTNQMAAVHSVLKRLVESGEIDRKEWRQSPGRKRYFWIAQAEPPKKHVVAVSTEPGRVTIAGLSPTVAVAADMTAHSQALRNRQFQAAISSQPMGSDPSLRQPKKERK